jgi:hypothetical protein
VSSSQRNDDIIGLLAAVRLTRAVPAAYTRLVMPARTRQTLFASLLYFGLACSVTWPIAIHPSTRVYGPIGADLTGSMAYFHSLAAAHTVPFLPGTVHAFNAPEGRSTQWALNFSTLPSSTLLWLGSMAFGSVATLAYWPIFTFTLSALSMFLLVRWLTGSWQAGLVAGFAFGFWPYVFSGMNQPLGDEWVIVLAVWRMLVTIEHPTVRNGLIAGATVAFALMWVQYFILIVGIAWVVLTLLALVIARMRGQFASAVRAHAVAAVPVFLTLASIALVGLTSNFAGAPVRATSELVTYSARPLMYLLPDPNNPFFGTLSKPIIYRDYFSPHSSATYGEVYVGISVIVLAAGGVVLLARTIRRSGWRLAMADRAILAATLLAITALCALAFSAPPRILILGVNIPMPIEIVSHITTVFRTTARLAVIVMLGLCVLAGLALSRLFSRMRQPAAFAVCAALSVVVVGDLWARPPYQITPIVVPPMVRLLAHQPPGVYATYPLQVGANFGGESHNAFYQAYAGDHDLFDGFFPGTSSESRKMELQFLLAARTVPDLAAMGVRYLLANRVTGPPPPMYPSFAAPIPGAQLIGTDSESALYRIVARPRAVSSFDSVGFTLPEGPAPQFYRWMTAADGEIDVTSRASRPVAVRVSFTAVSYVTSRRLVIRDGARVVYDAILPYAEAPVAFTISVRGDTTLYLHATPPPQSPHTLNPANADTRTLSIRVSDPPRLTPLPTR